MGKIGGGCASREVSGCWKTRRADDRKYSVRGLRPRRGDLVFVKESSEIEKAFRFCREIAFRHYENFPVASLFIPREKRKHVAAIYAFARTADDVADENGCPKEL